LDAGCRELGGQVVELKVIKLKVERGVRCWMTGAGFMGCRSQVSFYKTTNSALNPFNF